jgi:PAS domain S-box-containing protein
MHGMRVTHAEAGEVFVAVAETDREFRILIDAARDYAIVLLDRRGRVATWNAGAARLVGYTAEEILGSDASRLYTEADRLLGKPDSELQTARDAGRFEQEGRRARKDGTSFPANVVLTALTDAAGEPLGFAEVIHDLTGRRDAAVTVQGLRDGATEPAPKPELEDQSRQMHEAHRLKSEFLANMSHELRTPLNAIIGFAELMFKGKAGPVSDDHREYLGDILTSSQHLLQLISDAVDLARIESGALVFRPRKVDLAKIAGEVHDILRGLAATKHIGLAIEVDPALDTVMLDPGKLKQVLYSYLSNALKFTRAEGRVTLRVMPGAPGSFRIEVEDTGIGVRPEDMHRLFVEFQRIDAEGARRFGGTGMGLALTQRIVEAQGGSVGVRSQPGEGSVFWATLPMGGVDGP